MSLFECRYLVLVACLQFLTPENRMLSANTSGVVSLVILLNLFVEVYNLNSISIYKSIIFNLDVKAN